MNFDEKLQQIKDNMILAQKCGATESLRKLEEEFKALIKEHDRQNLEALRNILGISK